MATRNSQRNSHVGRMLKGKPRAPVRVVPWLEVNYPDRDHVAHAIEGLRIWQTITDTAIVSTVPRQSRIYTELRRQVPGMSLIPGIKTAPALGDDPLGNLKRWETLAGEIASSCQAAGETRFLLENEKAFSEHPGGKPEFDLGKLREGLGKLPADLEYLWYPSVEGGGQRLRRRVAMCEVVQDVLDVRFVDHTSLRRPVTGRAPTTSKASTVLNAAAAKPTIPMVHCRNADHWHFEGMARAFKLVARGWGSGSVCIPYPGEARWLPAARAIAALIRERWLV